MPSSSDEGEVVHRAKKVKKEKKERKDKHEQESDTPSWAKSDGTMDLYDQLRMKTSSAIATASAVARPTWVSGRMQLPSQPKFRGDRSRGSKGKSGKTYESQVFRCAVCRVDSSGEVSFRQHIQGQKHAARNRGKRGFAGLLPNDAGIIPPWDGSAGQAAQPAQPSAIRIGSTVSQAGEDMLQSALQDMRGSDRYDPNDTDEAAARAAALRSAPTHSQRGKDSGVMREAPQLIPPVLSNGGPLARAREALPVYQYREKILEAIAQKPVVVIEGQTGCGKTTQVHSSCWSTCVPNLNPSQAPWYVLDHVQPQP